VVKLAPSTPSLISASIYQVGDDTRTWAANLPSDAPILVHIDMDYFNDRYDGDSNWLTRPHTHDPDEADLAPRLDAVLQTLDGLRSSVSNVAIGVSPGFFPAEYWSQCIERIDNTFIGWDRPPGWAAPMIKRGFGPEDARV
jgi:hypothetical protein